MVQSSQPGSHPSGLKKVWTFVLEGGQPMQLRLQGLVGPGLDHKGQRSLWKMVGTAEEAEAAKALFSGPLVQAKVTLYTEGDDDEVEALRHQGEPDAEV